MRGGDCCVLNNRSTSLVLFPRSMTGGMVAIACADGSSSKIRMFDNSGAIALPSGSG